MAGRLRVLGHELNHSLTLIKSIVESLRGLLTCQPRAEDWEEDGVCGLGSTGTRSEGLSRFLGSDGVLGQAVALLLKSCHLEVMMMTLKVDEAGRVVLPKSVRERLGLHEGSDLELEVTREGPVLKPAGARPSMVNKHGLWVHTAKLPGDCDVVQAIREDREEEIRKKAGL